MLGGQPAQHSSNSSTISRISCASAAISPASDGSAIRNLHVGGDHLGADLGHYRVSKGGKLSHAIGKPMRWQNASGVTSTPRHPTHFCIDGHD
jgi:hypothetical protein